MRTDQIILEYMLNSLEKGLGMQHIKNKCIEAPLVPNTIDGNIEYLTFAKEGEQNDTIKMKSHTDSIFFFYGQTTFAAKPRNLTNKTQEKKEKGKSNLVN